MNEKLLTSFLIGFSMMFTFHYMLEPTWGLKEPRPLSLRMIGNYAIGTIGICISFLYIHPDMLRDLAVSVAGAASATILAHSRDEIAKMLKRDQAHGLIEDSKEKS